MILLKHLRWALLWALLILVLCAIPGKELPNWHWFDLFSLDKWVHAGMFAVLMLLLLRGALRDPAFQWKRSVMLFLPLAIAYGGALELMQGSMMQGRSADVSDFVANTVGCAVGTWWVQRGLRQAPN